MPKMKILLAEDETRVARFLEDALKAESHEVRLCGTVGALREVIHSGDFSCEVVVLDRLLQGADSLEVLPELKRRHPEAPVLILSAVNSAEEKAKALDLGADDYLAKPFSLVELSARLRALGRRKNPGSEVAPPTVHALGNLTMDLLGHFVSVSGRRVDFTPKEFQLLRVLLKRPGQVYSKPQLLDSVWDIQAELESNVVEATVRNVRRKLEESASTARIESRRNLGYWIES
jgi:two-component system copper resistance phosphate regulon response regulator CusR